MTCLDQKGTLLRTLMGKTEHNSLKKQKRPAIGIKKNLDGLLLQWSIMNTLIVLITIQFRGTLRL